MPYSRNARTHSAEQVAQIAASIVEFGFNAPILVDGHAGIVAGHGRLLAARKLGLPEVPVVVLDHLTDTQRRAYIIADNKLSENAGWDEEILAAELADLEHDGVDLKVVGFSDEELEALLANDDDETPEDEEPLVEPPAEPVTRPGDVWVIGTHRLICGDYRDFRAIARMFDGRKANVVITSPPYASQRAYDPASGFRPVSEEEYVAWYADVAANVAAVLACAGYRSRLLGRPDAGIAPAGRGNGSGGAPRQTVGKLMKIARDRATGTASSSKPELVLRDLAVERWPIDKLIPYARNARTHSEAQVAQVAASIIEFGWTNPILAGADGVIIAGHARLAAARKLKLTEDPVIVLDHLTPTQRRTLVLADNRLALNAGWDEEMLRVELESLEEDGFDLDLAGFTGEEIAELLRDPEETFEGLTDDDAIPEELERAVTMVGDVWGWANTGCCAEMRPTPKR